MLGGSFHFDSRDQDAAIIPLPQSRSGLLQNVGSTRKSLEAMVVADYPDAKQPGWKLEGCVATMERERRQGIRRRGTMSGLLLCVAR